MISSRIVSGYPRAWAGRPAPELPEPPRSSRSSPRAGARIDDPPQGVITRRSPCNRGSIRRGRRRGNASAGDAGADVVRADLTGTGTVVRAIDDLIRPATEYGVRGGILLIARMARILRILGVI